METVTVREFYRDAALVDRLADGKQLIVTANGKPKFLVTKCAKPRMTRELAEARAIGDSDGPKFDGTAFLVSLKR